MAPLACARTASAAGSVGREPRRNVRSAGTTTALASLGGRASDIGTLVAREYVGRVRQQPAAPFLGWSQADGSRMSGFVSLLA